MMLVALNHLWQSSAVLAVAALLALWLRRYPARARFWVWTAASLKFLVPFAALAAWSGRIASHPTAAASPIATRLAQPFVPAIAGADFSPLAAAPAAGHWYGVWALEALWLAGCLLVLAYWLVRWLRVARARRAGVPATGALAILPIGVIWTDSGTEPGVFGILRPVLLLPAGLGERLTPEQLRVVIAHEVCHVRRRDNLWSALHLLVQALFWFYPPVWWLGARLVAERESACDEAVLAQGADAKGYAEGILQVCRHYAAAPTAWVAGVAGGDLRRRIAAIMNATGLRELSRASRWALAGLLLAVVAAPLAGGRLFASQAGTAKPRFDVASIHEWGPGQGLAGGFKVGVHSSPGRIYAQCVSLNGLIGYAFHLTGTEPVEGAPSWAKASCGYPDSRGTFTIEATEPAETTEDQSRQMMQSLLADRFKLAAHWDTRQMPIYALVIAPGGFKLQPSDPDKDVPPKPHSIGCPTEDPHCHTGVCCGSMKMTSMTWMLTGELGRPVIDKTGLQGYYNFGLMAWAGDDAAGSPLPSLPTLLRDKFGLEYKSETGPVAVLVIEHVEKLNGN